MPTTPIRLAVAGRPNVGKSTLINTWLGEERLVAFDQPGTTRDAISVPFERQGQRFELIDTAGLRRKGRVFEASRSSRWSRRCRPSPMPTWCCCCWTPPRA
jgi:GTP-binding protein